MTSKILKNDDFSLFICKETTANIGNLITDVPRH